MVHGYNNFMTDSQEQALGNAASDNAPQIGGDAHTLHDAGDMIRQAENERSHTTQQLSEEDMVTARADALSRIDQIFADGNSIEMARNIVGNPQSPIVGEIDALIDKMKSKHGDVPETQTEANHRKEEAAKEISSALGVAAAVGAAAAGAASQQQENSGFLSSLFGSNDKYLEGPSAILPPSAALEAEQMGGMLAQHVQDIVPLNDSPSAQNPTHGIPGKIQNQQQGVGV